LSLTTNAGLRKLLFRRRALRGCRAEQVIQAPNGSGALQGVVLEGWDNIKLFAVIVQSILLPAPPHEEGSYSHREDAT